MKTVGRVLKSDASSEGLTSMLSPLEADVCQVLWRNCVHGRKMRVREIHAKLSDRRMALTSVAVILDRLYKQGLVGREAGTGRGGVYYLYYPKASKEQVEHSLLDSAVNKLIRSFGPSAVSYFNERFSKK